MYTDTFMHRVAGFLLMWLLMSFHVGFVTLVCMSSLAYAADLTAYIMACDAGTPEMNVRPTYVPFSI